MEKEIPKFKNGSEVSEWLKANDHVDYTSLIVDTDDGQWICIRKTAYRVDKHFKTLNPHKIELPVIGYKPHADRAILFIVSRQTQYHDGGGGLVVPFHTVKIPNKPDFRYDKRRYFVVACGSVFTKMATGNTYETIQRGDEVILADHLEGIPYFPTIEDPTGLIVNECISIHYTEIAGYVIHHLRE
jgi:hypothetical protein